MKMYVLRDLLPCSGASWGYDLPISSRRLMSDYEVTLVNDCMQEFYVRFYGPAESKHSQS